MPTPYSPSFGKLTPMPHKEKQYQSFVKIFERIVKEEGQQVLGWRKVHTINRSMGETAKAREPYVSQIFIGKNPSLKDQLVSAKAHHHLAMKCLVCATPP